jgi:2-oxoglutarate dehydrogenase E2 component (dihydrolipoamide succinyltransferase)
MKVEMVMPQMGESIAEGTIIKWLKREGDTVGKDENILEISTDKVDSEIPSPTAGKIVALLANEGDTVPVGQVIAHIETEAGAAQAASPAPAAPKAAEPRPEPKPSPGSAPSAPSALSAPSAPPAPAPARPAAPPPPAPVGRKPEQAPAAVAAPAPAARHAITPSGPAGVIPTRDDGGRFYSPLVRAIAQKEGVSVEELARIPGTGRGGRVSKNDLASYLETRGSRGTVAAPAPRGLPAPAAQAPRRVAGEIRMTPEGPVEVVAMDHIRQKIAEHMVRSKATSPHVASVTEVDMTRVVRWREAQKAEFEQREGFKLTYTPVFVQAVVRALQDFPIMNASLAGTDILFKRYINIGMAVAVDYGLIVPVIKGADSLNFLGIARVVHDLATRARGRALKPDEVSGGTFSITNMGTVGTLFGVPIIAQPQVGILGIGTIQKRPVVREDAIAIREMMYLCLSYDHRLIDGATGGSFVEQVAHHLETMELP